MDSPTLLTARGLTMQFPGVRALSGVDFDLRAGEVHALCGANGAGKSTLIKILGGVIPHGAHGGTVSLDGVECRFGGPGDALRAGIRVIHQELALCPDLSVAENIFLGAEPLRFGLPDFGRMHAEARTLLDRLGLPDLDPARTVGELPVGLRQLVEIARALRPDAHPAKVLILDEPTSALSAREASRLEETLHDLRASGLGLLYISHRLDEVFRLADRLTVLRGGLSLGTDDRDRFDPAETVRRMSGDARASGLEEEGGTSEGHAGPGAHAVGAGGTDGVDGVETPPRLTVRGWTVPAPDNPSRNVVEDVSFDLHAGEILGLAGLMGAGRTELAESLCGLFPARGRGTLLLDGIPYVPRDAAHALASGLALVCEDRRARGLFADDSVRANTTVSSLREFCALGWLTREDRERAAAAEQVERLRVKTPDVEFPIGNLSGGNQQKALLGRALLTRPRVLILDEPTRGIDVGAKAELHARIRALAAQGMAVLVVSSEADELLGLAHRVLVLRAGRVVAERPADTLTPADALALASGAAA